MEFIDYREEAIRYWERRRIVWNILLVPPTLFAYMFAVASLEVGDRAVFGYPFVVAMLCFAAVAANICYSFAYAVEFWFAGHGTEDTYRSSGRTLLFALGCIIGIGLAVAGGHMIAVMQYPALQLEPLIP